MKKTIFLTGLLLCGLFGACAADQMQATSSAASPTANEGFITNSHGYRVDGDIQSMMDSWPKGAETNGIACALQISRNIYTKGSPFCSVNIINTTTNNVLGYLHLSIEEISNIELFDPQGKPVIKTTVGKQFYFRTDEQIKDILAKINPMTLRRKGSLVIHGLLYAQISNNFSIPEAFQLRQPGEYTFHVSVRLVKNEQDASGRFLTTLLPEVVTKVQIRPDDIPLENPSANNQTNSPAK